MRFTLPGLTLGPTDADLEHLRRHALAIKSPSPEVSEEAKAAALGLSVPAYRELKASLERLKAC